MTGMDSNIRVGVQGNSYTTISVTAIRSAQGLRYLAPSWSMPDESCPASLQCLDPCLWATGQRRWFCGFQTNRNETLGEVCVRRCRHNKCRHRLDKSHPKATGNPSLTK